MHVIRNGDDHGVEILALFIEHLAVIGKFRNVRKMFERAFGGDGVDVTESDDVFGSGATGDVALGFASGADGSDVELLIGRFVAQTLQRNLAAEAAQRNSAGQETSIEKRTTGDRFGFHSGLI